MRADVQVFVTRRLPGGAHKRLPDTWQVEVWSHDGPPGRDELRRGARDADGVLCLLTDRIDAALMDECPRLRVVSNMAVGVDNVDIAAAEQRGIAVGNTPDVLTDATADLTMALMLAAARRLPEGMATVRDGTWGPWNPEWLLGLELRGARLGIIGKGRIGRAVAQRAAAFGMEVVWSGRTGGMALDELLATSDVVSLHCPLTSSTVRLIDGAALAVMKPGALLVNTARGAIVDQDALVEALHRGHLGGAALDVTDPEPLPLDHPLLEAPNVIVLPHLGSATHRTRERMAEVAVANLIAGLNGEALPHAVTSSLVPSGRLPSDRGAS